MNLIKKTFLSLLPGICLLIGRPAFSQSMSNTDNVITLTNTCINGGVSNGTYTLVLNYYDLDLSTSQTKTFTGVNVAVSNGVMTITAPSGSFPSVATNGQWSLPDAYPGSIQLTSGSFTTFMDYFSLDGVTDQFNCVPLPVYFNSFTGTLSSGHVILNWQTGLEQNTTYIEIYRYTGSGGYYKIGQVPAAGNSNSPVNYTFTDANPCSTNVYYLKMLNSQGTQPIYSGNVSVGCTSCSCTLPSPVNCSFTINGPDLICNLEAPTQYTLSNAVPNYSTLTWSVDQPSAAYLITHAGYDNTKVTLLKKNTAAAVTLTATLSGCTNTITKYIAMGAPAPDIYADQECPDVVCQPQGVIGATSYQWILTNATTVNQTYASGSYVDFYIGDGSTYDVSLSYTNACGTSPINTVGNFWCDPGTSQSIQNGPVVSPNPSSGILTINMPPPSAPKTPSNAPNKPANVADAVLTPKAQTRTTPNAMATTPVPLEKQKIYMVRVVDAAGTIRKTFTYSGGQEQVSVNISDLNNGIYTIQVFNKKTWSSRQVILAK